MLNRARQITAVVIAILGLTTGLISKADIPRRSLELELGEVEGGSGYEIQVTRLLENGNKKPAVNFKIKSTKWSATLTPGKYELLVRSFDSRGVPGDWGAVQELVVKLPAVKLMTPEPGAIVKSDDVDFEKITFSWTPIDGAEKYKLKIMTSTGQVVQEAVEKGSRSKIKLPVAKSYVWSVTPIMAGEIEGDPTVSPPVFEIHGAKLNTPKIFPIDDINTTQMTWNTNLLANTYEYLLESQNKTGAWKIVDSKILESARKAFGRPLPSGSYRVKVRALAKMREPSEYAEREFKTRSIGARSPAAIDQVRSESTYESKSGFFSSVSYFISVINYSGNNLEQGSTGTATTYDAVGGTGRVGLGTWLGENSNWGLLATTDVSGFTISDPTKTSPQTFTYVSAALQGVYRMRVGALGQLRFTGGPQYRELPVTIGSIDGTSYDEKKISTIGPLLGIALYHGFHQKFGLQINAQTYGSVAAVSIPGDSNKPRLSYQLGLLGSMGITERLLGFAGYAYRVEQARYVAPGADTPQGILNFQGQRYDDISISGHYFNLMLEYGF